ncbi:unnamed protein product [Pocillopora meandrina]|uniref:Uncharacterized protein n=1 Tax=Pocillopora meandrina TaxID=46732 RepID=A0AAU9XQ62_9CNID|nr:unnamed protein product [Pocillopora meandrina]
MAPGKTHVHSKHKNKLHSKRKSSSGVKKAKKNTLSNKQLKEKTLQQIEEVNKSFTAVHNITSIKSRTQRESVSTETLANVKVSSTGRADLQERRNSEQLTVSYLERKWNQSASEGNLPGIVALLEQDPNLVTTQTALHWAAKKGRKDIAELLINTGIDVNMKSGYTALHLAVIQGRENVIASLFDSGADVDVRDNSGRKPKHYVKETTSLWIQTKPGFPPPAIAVLVSSGEPLNKGLQNIGSIFLQMKVLSNSLGTGLDKLDEEPGTLSPLTPRKKAARSASFVKICRNVTGKFKDKKASKLEIPEDVEDVTGYHRTGRARSAPDINHITEWSPRIIQVMP